MSTSPVPRSFSKSATTARQRRAIELLANGYTAAQAGAELGGITENGVRKLWARALRAQAAELRESDAYERGLAITLLRLETMLTRWLPRANQLDKDAADIALRILGLIIRVCGYDEKGPARGPRAIEAPESDAIAGVVLPADAIEGVLGRLEAIAGKHNAPEDISPVIAGELVGDTPQPNTGNEEKPS